MSHKPNVFSPPGTPLLERTVGELVAERPGSSRVFQNFGIDFCCQGGRTLRDACERKGVASESVVEQLEAELLDNAEPKENPATLPIPELAEYIVETHHEFLWRELPRLHAMSARVAQVHGGHTPSLVEVFDVFVALEEEMVSHMKKEEQVLFPTLVAICRNEAAPVPLNEPIACMMHEHESSAWPWPACGNSRTDSSRLRMHAIPIVLYLRGCRIWRRTCIAIFTSRMPCFFPPRRPLRAERNKQEPAIVWRKATRTKPHLCACGSFQVPADLA